MCRRASRPECRAHASDPSHSEGVHYRVGTGRDMMSGLRWPIASARTAHDQPPRRESLPEDMNRLRKYSLVAGVSYLLTFVSIPTLALYRSVRAPNFVVGSGPDTPVIVGALLEMTVALAGIGTAVA